MRRFRVETDMPEYNRWCVARGMSSAAYDDLPLNGWIEDGVGACFLWSTDTSHCFLEGVVTNPEASGEARLAFFDAGQAAAVACAKRLRFRHFISIATEPKLLKLGPERYGYTVGKPATLLHIELGE